MIFTEPFLLLMIGIFNINHNSFPFLIFYDIVWLVISSKKTTYLHKGKKKVWHVAQQNICNLIFFFQYPIETFLSIM